MKNCGWLLGGECVIENQVLFNAKHLAWDSMSDVKIGSVRQPGVLDGPVSDSLKRIVNIHGLGFRCHKLLIEVLRGVGDGSFPASSSVTNPASNNR